ncbi:MAG: hypothetical protein H6Q13_1152 [Bacteroidetes bacterium]|jgi:signal transduction histidine kinase/ligand-binding sensor domain-containing protein/DNA-binding response OmpR family regulator|nr:hypothetical protein [Bacteroidota bacterium]
MQKRNSVLIIIWLALLLATALPIRSENSDIINRLKFKSLSTINGLPTNEVRRLYQDKDGYIWIATTSGLCLYDAYQVKIYKSNLYTPNLLSNNNIRCLSEDNSHNLWIGTNNGVNILNKPTGKIRQIVDGRFYNNVVNTVVTTRSGLTFIGTEKELFRYDSNLDSCIVCQPDKENSRLYNVQHLFEDSRNQLWIATSYGLFRYDPAKDRYYTYSLPSAHFVFEDSKHRIWVGTFGSGLYLLENAYNPQKVVWHKFEHKAGNPNSLGDNVIYAIEEDLNTKSLWIGTRSGLSILSYHTSETNIINYQPGRNSAFFSFNEVNAIIRDKQGIMWLGMLGGGVGYVSTSKSMFQLDVLQDVKESLSSNAVRSILVDNKGMLWVGIGSYGFIVKDLKTGKWIHYKKHPDFAKLQDLPTINTMMQSDYDSKIWLGTFSSGIYIYDESKRIGERVSRISQFTHEWLPSSCIYGIKEDSSRNHWIATRSGLALLTSKNKGYNLTQNRFPSFFYCVEQDNEGYIWAGSGSYGAIRISHAKNLPESIIYREYSPRNGKLNCSDVQCIFQDSKNRLWLGTDGGGLNLYDKEKDRFVAVSSLLNIPGDGVFSIQEDNLGNLWMGTNAGLIKLSIQNGVDSGSYRLYTTEFGLQGNIFLRGASSKSKGGELFFGGHNGYNYFYPASIKDNAIDLPIVITDIKIYNQSWNSFDEQTQSSVSAYSPGYTHEITLKYDQNNFSIEFAALNYMAPMQCLYAYRLKGFDKKWQYADASRRFAYYNNLDAGTYEFELKASNEGGLWSVPLCLKVVVLPPPWETWWAYTLYFIALVLIVYYLYRVARNRVILKNQLHLKELEQSKAEELNHAKLQFFTNITHELLTPLTIISATVDELKLQAPQHDDLYAVMGNNVRRLIRLLQQILEFRKAEAGNLKLKVSPGDVTAFVRREAESFLPLVKKRKLHFSVLCDPESIVGYFDPDKLDKIFYNLLSNSAKYNNEGGFVQVNLSYADNKDYILLRIRDNGKGISEAGKKDLFKRFYEGDYRKFNTIGTGIGLSLTKDLVELHGGNISVESELEKGTTFSVTLPIDRSYFKEEEIDEETMPAQKIVSGVEQDLTETNNTHDIKAHSILVLEDNLDLLQLMVKLLGREYNVFTGANGKEGIEVIENEDIDLVVSDIMMPEMDGIELCQFVKSKLEFSHIPVILLTAKNTEEDRAEAYESGADGFISKPFNLTVLHARIKNLLKYKERMARDFKNQLVFEVKNLNYTSLDEEFMQHAIDCVNKHLDDPDFDQLQFIEEMGTSKSTLYKKLKSLTGLNTSAFIRNIRLKAACRIMEEKRSIRVSELAYAVGFNDPKYFSSCFKKEFNMLPTEYIERFLPENHLP